MFRSSAIKGDESDHTYPQLPQSRFIQNPFLVFGSEYCHTFRKQSVFTKGCKVPNFTYFPNQLLLKRLPLTTLSPCQSPYEPHMNIGHELVLLHWEIVEQVILKALVLGPTPVQQVKIQVLHGRHHDSIEINIALIA